MLQNELKAFADKIMRLLNKEDLTREETKEMFCRVLRNQQPDLQQGAFLAALTAKGESPEEIAGAWEAIYEVDTVRITPDVPQPLVENSGTGMDSFKTFNISTAAAIVAAAGGVYLAKHGARAITSTCGAVDILEEVGIDVECDAEVVKRSIERAGIGIFNGMSTNVHPRALFRILSQIRFGTVLNIAGSLANPALPRYGVRGVHSRRLVEPVAGVMKEIGYVKALVFHGSTGNGARGMDEISTLGDTFIADLNTGGRITTYTVNPEDFDIKRPHEEVLRPNLDRKQEALAFISLLAGRDHGPRYDIVCLNAAPIFYLTGHARNLAEGFARAVAAIESGCALAKLREWVVAQNQVPTTGVRKIRSAAGGNRHRHRK